MPFLFCKRESLITQRENIYKNSWLNINIQNSGLGTLTEWNENPTPRIYDFI